MDKHFEYIGGMCSLIHRQSLCFFNKALKEQPIGQGQIFILMGIIKKPGRTQEELVEKTFLDKGTVAKAVKKLEESGFIKQEVNEKNKRQKLLYPLPKAMELSKEFFGTIQEWEEVLSAAITKEEKEQFLNILNKIANYAMKYEEKQGGK